MSKKFSYGYDVNEYIDKAFEQMKEVYFWVTKEMLNPDWTYAIEKDEDGRYQYVTYYDLELAPPSSFYVNKADLENDHGIKEFLGF